MDLSAISTVGKFLGTAGSASAVPLVAMYMLFTPQDEYHRHVADSKTGFVLELVSQAAQEKPGPFKDSLCRSLEEAIGELCANAPTHSMCLDRKVYREKAGCD